LLLHLATAYNHSESILPDKDYANQFDPKVDRVYCQFTHPGVLTALATIFVRDNKVIATMEVPLLTAVLTTVVASLKMPSVTSIQKVVIVKNPAEADSSDLNETCVDLVDTGKPLLLEGNMSVESFFKAT